MSSNIFLTSSIQIKRLFLEFSFEKVDMAVSTINWTDLNTDKKKKEEKNGIFNLIIFNIIFHLDLWEKTTKAFAKKKLQKFFK